MNKMPVRRIARRLGSKALAAAAGLALIGALSAHIISQTPQPERKAPSPGAEIAKFLADESYRLAFTVLSRNRDLAGSEENLVFSPFGIASAIAMIKCGAAGDTWSQLDLWGLRNGPPLGVDYGDEKINQVLARIIMLLQGGGPDIEVGLTNSLWTDKSLSIGPGFPDALWAKRFFAGEVFQRDYGQAKGVADGIDLWVKSKLKGGFSKGIASAELGGAKALQVASVMSFRGAWGGAFDPSASVLSEFFAPESGERQMVKFMRSPAKAQYYYLRGDGFQLVRIPFGTNPSPQNRYAMFVFRPDSSYLPLPPVGDTPVTSEERWRSLVRQMKPAEGSVWLPEFTMKHSVDLKEALKSSNLEMAFDPRRGDFRNLRFKPGAEGYPAGNDDPYYINQFIHVAGLEVDSKGLSGAAPVPTGAGAPAAGQAQPFVMKMDHPFFFVVVYEGAGQILLMGAVYSVEE